MKDKLFGKPRIELQKMSDRRKDDFALDVYRVPNFVCPKMLDIPTAGQ